MATMAILSGSVLGFFGAITAWLFFGATLTSAVTLYFATAFGLGLLPILSCALRSGLRTARIPLGASR